MEEAVFDTKGLFEEAKEGLHGFRVPSSFRKEEERIYKEPSPEVQIKFRETTDEVSSANAAGTPDRVRTMNRAYKKFESNGGSSSADGIATKTPSGRDRRVLADSVVIIDDDDDVTIDEELDSDAASAESSPRRAKQASAFDTVNDDDDDCQILGCRSPPKPQPFRKVAEKKLRSRNFPVNDYRDLSDCEVTMGSQSDIRRQWEEAALRKRVGKPATSKGSRIGKQDGGRASTKDGKKQSNHFGQPPFYANQSWRNSQGFAESVATSTSGAEEGPNETSNACNVQSREKRFDRTQPDSASGDVPVNCASPSEPKNTPSVADHSEVENSASKNVAKLFEETAETGNGDIQSSASEKPQERESVVSTENAADVSGKASQSDHYATRRMDFVADREKMKESAEFIKADEEEWARRQLELEKQAQETQRLRKRRRAEADRRMEMENRQKQRLEQIRENQLQEMKNTGMKEQIRGQVQMELERKTAGCVDLASLLRRLGISVEGGAHCTPQQVNAAYKKALLRFHPDRAAADDPRLHVEAEETFKLISRLKRTLQPVALNLHAVRR